MIVVGLALFFDYSNMFHDAANMGVAKNIGVAWFVTIPASAVMAGMSFFLLRMIHPNF